MFSCRNPAWLVNCAKARLLKALANEDTFLRTHCCRHKCFPVCPRAQHLLRTQILCPGHKNVSDFVQKYFVSATNVFQFAQPKKHHGQQCVRNNVSSFTSALTVPFLTCHVNTGKRSKFLSRVFPNLHDFNFSSRLEDFFNKARRPLAYAKIRSMQVA